MSAGAAGAAAVSCLNLYSLSSLHSFLFFHTTALRNNKLQESRTGLAAGCLEETPGNTCKRSGCRLWKRLCVILRSFCRTEVAPQEGGAVVSVCSP